MWAAEQRGLLLTKLGVGAIVFSAVLSVAAHVSIFMVISTRFIDNKPQAKKESMLSLYIACLAFVFQGLTLVLGLVVVAMVYIF